MADPNPTAENGDQTLDLDSGTVDGPSSLIGVGPPSPLTGCYLLIVIGEPHSVEHKDIILQRLLKGKSFRCRPYAGQYCNCVI